MQFVGINTETDPAAARAHERRFGVTYPSLDDDGGRVLLRLRGSLPPTATPSTLVLDRQRPGRRPGDRPGRRSRRCSRWSTTPARSRSR